MAVELAVGVVHLIPSARGWHANLRREIQGPVDETAKKAQRSIADALAEGGEDGGRRASASIGRLIGSAAIVAAMKKTADAASNLQQAVGGTAAVFGQSATAVEEFAAGAAEAVGLSERAARETTSRIGALLKGFGFEAETAAQRSIELTRVGADLAATFGGTTAEAVDALGAALRGEADPIERFGISIRQTAVDAKAVELGLVAAGEAVDPYAKAQATLALVTEQSAGALGQFARESGSAAGQAQIAGAQMENAAASLGEALLPVTSKAAEVVGFLAEQFQKLPDGAQTAVVAGAGLALVANTASTAASSVADLVKAARNAGPALRGLGIGTGVVGGLFAAAAGLDALEDSLSNTERTLEDFVEATDEALVAQFDALLFAARDFGTGAEDVFRGFAEEGQEGLGVLDRYREALEADGRSTAALDAAVESYAGTQHQANESSARGAEVLEGLGLSAGGAAGGVAELRDAVPPGDLLRAFADSLGAAEREADPLADALERNVSAMRDLFGQLASVEVAEAGFRSVIRGALSAADALPAPADLFERRDAFQEVLLDARDSAIDLAEALGREGVGSEEIRERVRALMEEAIAVGDEFGLTGRDVEGLATSIGALPDQVVFGVQSNLGEVIDEAERLRWLLAQVGGTVDGPNVFNPFGGPREHGGPVEAGTAYIVGERRPELFIPRTDGWIVPEVPTGAGAGGDVYDVDVHNYGPGEAAATELVRALRREKMLTGSVR